MSLRRLTRIFLALFLVAVVVTGVATYVVTGLTITRLVDQRIAAISGVVAGDGDGRADGAPAMIARIARFSRQRDTGDIGFLLLDGNGRTLSSNVSLRRVPPKGYSTLRAHDQIAGLTHGRALSRPVGDGMTLVTIAETEPFDHYDAARLRIYLGGFGSIVAIVLGGVAVFAMLVRRRISAMRETAEAIIGGDLQRRVPVTGAGDEFDRQALTFNHMLDRITELMDGLRHVSDDIAHDLRAPLARLRSKLALIANGAASPLREDIETTIADCDELLDLAAAILRIGEIQASGRADFAPIDLAALANEVAGMMRPVAEDGGRSIAITVPDRPLSVPGNQRLLTQALVNLIENALTHTPAGTRIAVSVVSQGDAALVVVSDDGLGIAAPDREQALRRFGRLDPSRSGPGHGLGLPLVAAIARMHRGSLTLSDADPGLAATMRIAIA